MLVIFLAFILYLLLIFSLIYVAIFVKSQRTPSKTIMSATDRGVSPSQIIVDSIGGDNSALPIISFLIFVSERENDSTYLV